MKERTAILCHYLNVDLTILKNMKLNHSNAALSRLRANQTQRR